MRDVHKQAFMLFNSHRDHTLGRLRKDFVFILTQDYHENTL